MRSTAFSAILLPVLLALGAAAQEPNPPPGRGGPRAGGPIELKPDDKPAFPEPPAGWDAVRDGIPHRKLKMVEYGSKPVGIRRKMNVYPPPGDSAGQRHPVLCLLHGIGGASGVTL